MPRVLSLAGLALFLLAPPARSEDSQPLRVVKKLDATLLDVLRDAEKLGYQGRADRLGPAVDEAFDIPFMAAKSIGQAWKTLSDAEREEWVALSRQFSVANYAANFDRWTGQTIEILGEDPAASDTVVVRTRIVDPKGESIDMSYRLHRPEGGWRIIDVHLKGTVSELALRRADYTSVLQREGFPALAALMRSRIAALAAGNGTRHGP